MDEIDHAMQREHEDRERAIAAVRGRTGGVSSGTCKNCGEPIPLARQLAICGVQRCIDCQIRHEILQRTTGAET